METKKKSPSWVSIIIWFIIFWPVSIYLIWKKLTTDKAAAMKNSKILKGIGYFFILGAVVCLFSIGEGDASASIAGFLFYLVGGILIIWGANKVKKSGETYKKYIEIVINQQQRTIDNIAAQMGIPYDKTVKGLQDMIDKGYFTGAYIDQANHEIVFPVDRAQKIFQQPEIQADTNSAPVQRHMVKCPNCGGNNVINEGQICECDFCGSPLEA